MISLQKLLDNEKCYEALRQARWPDGVRCPHCDAATLTRQGRDQTQPARQKYRCEGCGRYFDDLTGTVFAGHHQPLSVWILCLYFMGLNLSNAQIARELGLDPSDTQRMAEPLREGVVARQPEPVLSGEVECDEVYVIAGHKGRPEAVRRAGRRGRRRRVKGARGRGTLVTEKPPSFGMIQRGGAVVIRRVECTRRKAFGCCAVPGCDPIAGSRKRNRRCIWASFRLCITSAAGVKTCSAPCSPCWLHKQTELTGIHIEPKYYRGIPVAPVVTICSILKYGRISENPGRA